MIFPVRSLLTSRQHPPPIPVRDKNFPSLCKIDDPFYVFLRGMSRQLRFMPPEGSGLVEVTTRTVHGRFLLAPSGELNDLILGALGRAQELYSVRLIASPSALGTTTYSSKSTTPANSPHS